MAMTPVVAASLNFARGLTAANALDEGFRTIPTAIPCRNRTTGIDQPACFKWYQKFGISLPPEHRYSTQLGSHAV